MQNKVNRCSLCGNLIRVWRCETCGKYYCSYHTHITSKGTNIECLECEEERKRNES